MSQEKSAKSKKTAAKHPGGAPTKFKADYIQRASELILLTGATDLALAKAFGVSKATITNWKREHPEFLASVKKAKDIWDTKEVEGSLLKRARGFSYNETTYEPAAAADSKTGKAKLVKTKRVRKLVVPDVGAICFWLKNRNPKRWKDIKRTEITGEDGGDVKVNIVDKFDERESSS